MDNTATKLWLLDNKYNTNIRIGKSEYITSIYFIINMKSKYSNNYGMYITPFSLKNGTKILKEILITL